MLHLIAHDVWTCGWIMLHLIAHDVQTCGWIMLHLIAHDVQDMWMDYVTSDCTHGHVDGLCYI